MPAARNFCRALGQLNVEDSLDWGRLRYLRSSC
jgi:hypothetical protein